VDVVLVKPLTFMNRSGRAVLELVRHYELEPVDLLVVSDDTTLPLGSLRMRPEGSAGGHNGLRSIEESLGGPDYPRMRLGVGNAEMDRWPLEDFVLDVFREDEQPVVEDLLDYAADAARLWIVEDLESAVARFNRRVSLDAE